VTAATPPPEPVLEVPPGGAIVAHADDGGTLIIAFDSRVPAGRIAEVSYNLHHESGLKIIAVADVAAVKAWHPHDVPDELADIREQLDTALREREEFRARWSATVVRLDSTRAVLTEVLGEFDPSKGDGYRARVGQVKFNGWCERAGIEVPR
jgi:hypothetical protein